jgi:hypothetical protein
MQQSRYELPELHFSENNNAATRTLIGGCGFRVAHFSEKKSRPLNSFSPSPYPKDMQDKDLQARMTGLEPATSGVTGGQE